MRQVLSCKPRKVTTAGLPDLRIPPGWRARRAVAIQWPRRRRRPEARVENLTASRGEHHRPAGGPKFASPGARIQRKGLR